MKILQTTKVNIVPTPEANKLKFGHAVGFSDSNSKDMYHGYTDSKSIRIVNNFNKKTVNDISFGGLPLSGVEKIKASGLWKFFNKNWVKKFIAEADASQTIFDAIFALGITCILRPAAIMAQARTPKTKEKNKKAASHSISSGIIGYIFAVAVFSPIKGGLNKLKENPAKFAKAAEHFLNKKHNPQAGLNTQTLTMLINKSTEVLTASVRSAITIGMIPVIDKYVLNRIFGIKAKDTKQELQNPAYKYAYIVNFKNNQEQSKVFQNFTGVMK